ncbi:MAG: sugar phosphate isomerase/epimerase [Clostridia bacterium]|nr:sugar phosphate isomerase/epimerase [Clostridia bacterium]
MKISVSSYSFSQYIRAGKMTQLDCVKKAHELGITGIDYIDIDGATQQDRLDNAKLIRAEAEKYGIEIVAYTIGANLFTGNAESDDAEMKKLIDKLDVAEALGASLMRHDMTSALTGKGDGRSFDLMIPTLAERARRVTEIAASKGIRTCTENHGFISQDAERIERLYNAINHENFGLLIDIGNFACVDDDSVKAVSRLAPYAFHIHAKDFHKRTFEQGPAEGYFETRGCNYLAGCAIGEGDIPVAQCMAIIKKAGYDGWVTIEYEGGNDCIEGIARGRDYLEKVIG